MNVIKGDYCRYHTEFSGGGLIGYSFKGGGLLFSLQGFNTKIKQEVLHITVLLLWSSLQYIEKCVFKWKQGVYGKFRANWG